MSRDTTFGNALTSLSGLLPSAQLDHLESFIGSIDEITRLPDPGLIKGVTFDGVRFEFCDDLDEFTDDSLAYARLEGDSHDDERDNGFREELFWHRLSSCLMLVHYKHAIGEDFDDEPVSGSLAIWWPTVSLDLEEDALRCLLDNFMLAQITGIAKSDAEAVVRSILGRFSDLLSPEEVGRLLADAVASHA